MAWQSDLQVWVVLLWFSLGTLSEQWHGQRHVLALLSLRNRFFSDTAGRLHCNTTDSVSLQATSYKQVPCRKRPSERQSHGGMPLLWTLLARDIG